MAWTMTLSNRYVIGALCSTLKIWALAQRWRIGKDFESLLDPFVKSDRKMVSVSADEPWLTSFKILNASK